MAPYMSLFPKHFSVRGLLNCEHEPRGGTYWKSDDFGPSPSGATTGLLYPRPRPQKKHYFWQGGPNGTVKVVTSDEIN